MSTTNEPHYNAWLGGDCPVDHDAKVDVVLRSGNVENNVRAGSLTWKHEQIGADVTHFRLTPAALPIGAEYIRAIEDMKKLIRGREDINTHVEMGLLKDLNNLTRR